MKDTEQATKLYKMGCRNRRPAELEELREDCTDISSFHRSSSEKMAYLQDLSHAYSRRIPYVFASFRFFTEKCSLYVTEIRLSRFFPCIPVVAE